MFENPESRIVMRGDRFAEIAHRLVLTIVAERERSEVNRDAGSRLHDLMRLHRFRRIHVDGTHEPTREIRADGQEREADRLKSAGDFCE